MGERETGAGSGHGESARAAAFRSPVAVWVPGVYAAVSAIWIAFSDAIVAAAAPSMQVMAWWSTAKGFGFVLLTTALLHFMLRWALDRERRVEGALRSIESRYDLIAQHARDIILVIRREDGRILEANAAAAAAYGWSREALRGLTVWDLRPAADAPLIAAQIEAANVGTRFETVHRRKDGTTFPVEINSQGVELDGRRVLVSIIRDTSERRAAEEALRQSEERLALAVEAAGLGTFHATPWGTLEWSPRCRAIFGISDSSLPHFEAFLALVHPDDREATRAAAARWTDPAGDGLYHQEYRIVRPDGTVRWVSAHGKARFAEVDGVRRPVRLAGALLDITEVRAVQAQLMQSDRLASVGMLAAGVAHEINNPLAYLTSALSFLSDHADALGTSPALRGDLLQALADAREGAERVRHVVRDLRTFSGNRDERRSPVSLEQILESALHVAANELRYRARITRDYRPAPAVLADEARLGQVALNLLINAAQAIPEGQSESHEVRVATSTDASGRAVFEIRDTGAGIAAEIVDRIFDPFFTTKPLGVGTGLGLSICRGIVLSLGGEISVQSQPGCGTAVQVALPPALTQADEVVALPPAAPASRRGRVLVVDDEPAVASAIRRTLAPHHDVVVRASAEEVMDAIGRGERFDAILCDLMMPGMTGMDLHDALARVAPDQASRIVVLTGGAFTPRAREFLDRVALPRCEKPFDAETLRATVRRVVG